MTELDTRIYNAIKKLDSYFGEYKYIICGSIGLYLQGVDLGREPHDFDVIIPTNRDRGLLKRLFRIIYKESGFILDFPIRPKEGEEKSIIMDFNGLSVRVQAKNDILLCKQLIVDKHLYSYNSEEKQKQDIIKIKETI